MALQAADVEEEVEAAEVLGPQVGDVADDERRPRVVDAAASSTACAARRRARLPSAATGQRVRPGRASQPRSSARPRGRGRSASSRSSSASIPLPPPRRTAPTAGGRGGTARCRRRSPRHQSTGRAGMSRADGPVYVASSGGGSGPLIRRPAVRSSQACARIPTDRDRTSAAELRVEPELAVDDRGGAVDVHRHRPAAAGGEPPLELERGGEVSSRDGSRLRGGLYRRDERVAARVDRVEPVVEPWDGAPRARWSASRSAPPPGKVVRGQAGQDRQALLAGASCARRRAG